MKRFLSKLGKTFHVTEWVVQHRWPLVALFLAMSGVTAWGQLPKRAQKKDRPRLSSEEINRGSAGQAQEYGHQIASEVGFVDGKTPESLDDLLAWAGYTTLKAIDIERLDSETLMDFERLAKAVSNASDFQAAFQADSWGTDNLLVTRLFAPKTTDSSAQENPIRLSWRKLVRLRTQPKSNAAVAGISAVYFSGNIYTADLEKSPFEKEAKSNQVILVRKQVTPKIKSAIYWLVYGPLSQGGKLTQYTETSWDAIDPENSADKKPKTPLKKYYVPDSCVQCHGLKPETAMLAYLDTDYWLDRSLDDFTQVSKSRWGVLFDGGKDPATPRYKQAMDVVRKMNREIAAQNRSIDPLAFQTRASENWGRLHQSTDAHLPPMSRGIASQDGNLIWKDSTATEKELLPLLNRYCFRCHSNLHYHVFDKSAVLERVGMMTMFLEDGYMPRDRTLSNDVRDKMIGLLKKLQEENPEKN